MPAATISIIIMYCKNILIKIGKISSKINHILYPNETDVKEIRQTVTLMKFSKNYMLYRGINLIEGVKYIYNKNHRIVKK